MRADDYWDLSGHDTTYTGEFAPTATGASPFGQKGVEPFHDPKGCRWVARQVARQSQSYTTIARIELEYLNPS